MRKVEEGVNQNHPGIEYLTEDVLQLQIISTKAKMGKAERITKMTHIDGICKGGPINRDSVKSKVT